MLMLGAPRKVTTTNVLEIPKELPSVEEALKILAATLKTAAKPVLNEHVG